MAKDMNKKLELKELFTPYENDIDFAPKTKNKKKKLRQDVPEFKKKMDDGLLDEMLPKDWIYYFQMKARQHGVNYIIGNWVKETSIVKSAIKKVGADNFKLMIDFVWDAPHTLVDKRTMGLFIFCGGWLNTVYNSSLEWKEGVYGKKQEPVREYKPKEDSPKKSKITF